MVDVDRAPDPLHLLAQLIAGQYGRAAELDALTDATHDRDAAITANYLVDPAEIRAVLSLIEPALVKRLYRRAAVGEAVDKAKGRGEVEVLIANLEADAHRTQHDQETT